MLSRLVCQFRNHLAEPVWRNGAYVAWRCNRCGAYGPKLPMTLRWLYDRARGGDLFYELRRR